MSFRQLVCKRSQVIHGALARRQTLVSRDPEMPRHISPVPFENQFHRSRTEPDGVFQSASFRSVPAQIQGGLSRNARGNPSHDDQPLEHAIDRPDRLVDRINCVLRFIRRGPDSIKNHLKLAVADRL